MTSSHVNNTSKLPKCPREPNQVFANKYRSRPLQFFPFPLLSTQFPVSGFPAMLSTFPSMPSGDSWPVNPFSPLDGGFASWDYHEPPFLFKTHSEEQEAVSSQPSHEPVSSNSGSYISNSATPTTNPFSHEASQIRSKTMCLMDDDRKRKRTASNRESARRSRVRKQMHLDKLNELVSGLRLEKFELMNRVSSAAVVNQLLSRENEFLRSESLTLRERLLYIRQVLLLRQRHQHIYSPEISMAMH